MMKITIIDNDLIVSDQILAELYPDKYETHYVSSIKMVKKNDSSDIFLLSTDCSEEESARFIKQFKHKIIILMASTYTDSTVRIPLALGAKDYVVKPFLIEELERKIDYFRLKTSINSYQSYLKHSLKNVNIEKKYLTKFDPPVIIHTNCTTFIDQLIIEYCQNNNNIFMFISLNSKDWREEIKNTNSSHYIYLSNLQLLSRYEVKELFTLLKNKKFIISTTQAIKTHYEVLKIDSDMQLYDGSYIISIEEYIQFIIKNFQYKVTDTEMAKQLDFSRKTLYERRNKYKIFKTKKGKMIS